MAAQLLAEILFHWEKVDLLTRGPRKFVLLDLPLPRERPSEFVFVLSVFESTLDLVRLGGPTETYRWIFSMALIHELPISYASFQ
jgi:hypothetical protein